MDPYRDGPPPYVPQVVAEPTRGEVVARLQQELDRVRAAAASAYWLGATVEQIEAAVGAGLAQFADSDYARQRRELAAGPEPGSGRAAA